VRELGTARGFREAEVEVCDDVCLPEQAAAAATLQRKLRKAFAPMAASMPEAQEQLDQLLSTHIPLDMLTDVISYMLYITPEHKQSLLAEVNVCRRAEMLLEYLAGMANDSLVESAAASLGFPPPFSVN
jgi:Lon protease-like protein